MAKLNINTATRDELLEGTGLRAEVVDSILKLREEAGGIGNAEDLQEIQGVGPATVEQIRNVLDFGRRSGQQHGGNGSRSEEDTRPAARAARETAMAGAQSTIRTAKRAAEGVYAAEHAMTDMAAEGLSNFSSNLVEIMSEQARENMMLAMAMLQVQSWSDLGRMQSEYLQHSVDRAGRLASAYVDCCSGMMRVAPPTSQPPH